MKKVINITLGKVVFAIEEDAYELLRSYLDQIRQSLSSVDDKDEIVGDVESSISEKLFKLGRNEKSAVTFEDIKSVKSEMGDVSDFDTEEKAGDEAKNEKSENRRSKRLYRDPDDQILGGVASGISQYFDVDPVLIRLLFVVLAFMGGSGIPIYIVLWILIPEAKTTAEKYEMKGEKVSLSSIRENVEEGIKNVKKKDLSGFRKVLSIPIEIFRYLVKFLKKVFDFIFPILRIVIGIVFTIAGAMGIAGVIFATTAIVTGSNFISTDPVIDIIRTNLFTDSGVSLVIILSLLAVAIIPVITLTLLGVSILRRKNRFSLDSSLVLLVTWFVALGLLVGIGAGKVEETGRQIIELEGIENYHFNLFDWD